MWAAFIIVEMRAAEPIIDPALFRNRTFAVSVAATFLAAGGMFGAIMFLPLFVQGALGESATNAGAVLTPMMLGFVVSSAIGGQIMSRTGRYKALLLLGFAVAVAGMFLLSRMDTTASQGLVVRNMAITGLGVGVGVSLFTIVVQNAFPSRLLGQVTASVQFFRSIGGTISVAIFGTVMINRFQDELAARMPAGLVGSMPSGATEVVENPQALLSPEGTAALQQRFTSLGPQGQALFDQFLDAVRTSLSGAITDLFLAGCALMLLGLIVTLFLPELPLRKSQSFQTQRHEEHEGAQRL
jgi:MFS family permease